MNNKITCKNPDRCNATFHYAGTAAARNCGVTNGSTATTVTKTDFSNAEADLTVRLTGDDLVEMNRETLVDYVDQDVYTYNDPENLEIRDYTFGEPEFLEDENAWKITYVVEVYDDEAGTDYDMDGEMVVPDDSLETELDG